MDYYKQFKKHLSNNDYPSFLSLWEEYCESDEIDGEELKEILLAAKEAKLTSSFGLYVEHILPLWEKIENSSLSRETLALVYDLQTTNTSELATRAIAYLKARFGEEPDFAQKLKMVGLREQKEFRGAIRNFELLVHLKKGNFVFHTGGWGVGEIMDVSSLREQISIEFDYVSGIKDFSFKNAFKALIPIPKEHFLAMRFGDPDKLEEWAKRDPVAVIRRLLSDLGPKTAAEIKDELADLVIPEKEWSRWWQTARNKLKKDSLIETPDDLRTPFFLRENELSPEERLNKSLDKCEDTNTFIQMVYTFLRDFSSALKKAEFKDSLSEKILETIKNEELNDSQELQLYFLLEELAPAKAGKAQEELIKRFSNLKAVIGKIEIIAYKKRALVLVHKLRPDWSPLFLELIFALQQNPLRDYMLQVLIKEKKSSELKTELEKLFLDPLRHPQATFWYMQKVMTDESLPFADKEGKCRVFEAFLALYYQLEKEKGQRDLLKKMQNFMISGRFANVRAIFQGASKEMVHEFLLLATKCHTLTDHAKKIFHSLAEVVHPSLGSLSSAYQDKESDEIVVWTTEEGFNKVKERMHQIATVETVENAKQVEIARGYGDLRENAEYKSALEQRSRLQSELKRLSDLIGNMRIMNATDVDTSSVNVGCVVECSDEKGEKTTFTLLGPWDAKPEENILSFQSKLAKEMTGLKVGDTFKSADASYTINKIRNYFA
ncbi:MAG: GreA/GreB family elongation factor [Candidatus Algichlamydia australiensis]|nr:GreA/GreB family elongation factor [Chlamydiales bacterium]